MAQQFHANPLIWFHEHYHYWQGLRLPFLFWYAAFSFRAVFTGFADFLKTSLPFETWSFAAPQLSYLSLKMRCMHMGGDSFALGSEEAEIPAECAATTVLTLIDLIEGMTSIAEWQVQAQKTDLEDPRAFSRWTKRHAAYLDGFRFVASALGDEALALRIFSPLVETAFCTSQPMRAFLQLLAFFQKFRSGEFGTKFVAQQEPCRWGGLFSHFLTQFEFEAAPDSVKGVLVDQPFCLLDRENLVGGSWIGASFLHPFLTPNARKWVSKEKENPQYTWLLAQPGWVSTETFWEAFNNFYPPVNILHFVLGGGINRILIGGRPEGAAEILIDEHPGGATENFLKSANLLTLMTAFSVVRRATHTHFSIEARLCHHSDCPHYGPNYCNLYPVVPESWEKCRFPWRVNEISEMIKSSALWEDK